MLLTFNVLYDQLVLQKDPVKLQTTRLDEGRWYNWAMKAHSCEIQAAQLSGECILLIHSDDRVLHMKWRNPRNGGLPIGRAVLRQLEVKRFDQLDMADAVADGFPMFHKFLEALQERNDIPSGDTLFGLLTFRWTDGPHDIVCRNCLKRKKSQLGRELSFCVPCMENGENPKGGKLTPRAPA